jgi:hypothetical protein
VTAATTYQQGVPVAEYAVEGSERCITQVSGRAKQGLRALLAAGVLGDAAPVTKPRLSGGGGAAADSGIQGPGDHAMLYATDGAHGQMLSMFEAGGVGPVRCA